MARGVGQRLLRQSVEIEASSRREEAEVAIDPRSDHQAGIGEARNQARDVGGKRRLHRQSSTPPPPPVGPIIPWVEARWSPLHAREEREDSLVAR